MSPSLFDPPPAAPPTGPDGPGPDLGPGDGPTSDLACEVCGAPAERTPTGRAPKHPLCANHKRGGTSARSTRGNTTVSDKELNQACASLRDMYDLVVIPLTALDPVAGAVWQEQIDKLDERNHTYLASNRDLVRKINSVGQKSSTWAFALSHVVAVAPVVLVLVMRQRARVQQARDAQAQDTYGAEQVYVTDAGDPFAAPAPGDPFNPDAAFAG